MKAKIYYYDYYYYYYYYYLIQDGVSEIGKCYGI
jgi:hypothetical protein